MKKYLWLILVVTLLTGCLVRPIPTPDFSDPEQAFPPTLVQHIDTHVQQKFDSNTPFAGLVVAIDDGEHPVFIKSYGYADLENEVPTEIDTVYRIASLSKTFTAAAVLKLAEEKHLQLSDPVTRFFPDLPGAANEVTVQQLLNHKAGLPDNKSLIENMAIDPSATYTSDELHNFLKEVFEVFEIHPGEEFVYSNVGYRLLGLIIEGVSGMTYGDYLEQTFFVPLGMTSTSHCVDEPERMAQGYQMVGGDMLPVEPESASLLMGSGSLCSTARDLVRWQHALEHGLAINPSSYQKMMEPLTTLDLGTSMAYAYGLGMESFLEADESVWVGHSGAVLGFTSNMRHYTEDGVTVVLLTNTTPPNYPLQNADMLHTLSSMIIWRYEQHFGTAD